MVGKYERYAQTNVKMTVSFYVGDRVPLDTDRGERTYNLKQIARLAVARMHMEMNQVNAHDVHLYRGGRTAEGVALVASWLWRRYDTASISVLLTSLGLSDDFKSLFRVI